MGECFNLHTIELWGKSGAYNDLIMSVDNFYLATLLSVPPLIFTFSGSMYRVYTAVVDWLHLAICSYYFTNDNKIIFLNFLWMHKILIWQLLKCVWCFISWIYFLISVIFIYFSIINWRSLTEWLVFKIFTN